MFLLGVPLFLVGLAVIFTQAEDILTCIHFPEKQIVEYVKVLMSNA
jgi:hypothetical protein